MDINNDSISDYDFSSAWLTLNRTCNNRCTWCYAKDTKYSKEVLQPNLFSKLLYFFEEIGVTKLTLLGGEPTLYPYLSDIFEQTRRSHIIPFLVSNGRRFKDFEFCKKLIDSGMINVVISAKASNNIQYKQLAGAEHGFDEMMEGYRNLRQLGIEPSFSITIVKPIMEDILSLIHFLEDEGVARLSIHLGSPILFENKPIANDLIANPKEMCKSVVDAYILLRESSIDFAFYHCIPLCLLPSEIKNEMLTKKIINTSCQMQKGDGITFNEKGDLLICNHFLSYPLGTFGIDFTTKNDFDKFIQQTEIIQIRKLTLRYPSMKCSKCPDWTHCGGGCFIKWLVWNPDDYIPGHTISRHAPIQHVL